jgi:hypothetical protein
MLEAYIFRDQLLLSLIVKREDVQEELFQRGERVAGRVNFMHVRS